MIASDFQPTIVSFVPARSPSSGWTEIFTTREELEAALQNAADNNVDTTSTPQYPVISVTQGMSGHFAVLYWWNPEGFPEPYQTGFGRYATKAEAISEARGWAEAEGVRLDSELVP